MYNVVIVVGLLIILLLLFIIFLLRIRIKILKEILTYTVAFYKDMYCLYDKYLDSKEDKTNVVLSILNLCKLQRNKHKEIEKAFEVK